ncbi:MAG TPA: FAD:protein FMN transferase [Patescibacteria group bacterium]|nr:FAD:protein FMN transferase [Patescibacteria group bacterium]
MDTATDRTLYNKWFRVMGGWGLLRFVDSRGVDAAEAIALRAMSEAERIERKYSRFIQTSVVSRINRDAGRTPVAVDEETVSLVAHALSLAATTRGAFDPTVGVMRRLWNFREERVPEVSQVEALRRLVDYREVSVRDGTVFLRLEGMELDLGGVGKEYAVDRVAACLRAEGVESAVVNLAGDLRTVGSRGDGRPWKIGVMDPRSGNQTRFSVRLVCDGGVASSGDYERCFIKDGVRYHHLLDARTGFPARGLAATTAVAATAFDAGLAATAAFLLGPEEGLRHLEETPGVQGALITEQGDLLTTSAMRSCTDLPGSIYSEYPLI